MALAAGVNMLLLFGADVAGAGTLVLLTGGLPSLIFGPVMWAGLGRALLRDAAAPVPVRAVGVPGA